MPVISILMITRRMKSRTRNFHPMSFGRIGVLATILAIGQLRHSLNRYRLLTCLPANVPATHGNSSLTNILPLPHLPHHYPFWIGGEMSFSFWPWLLQLFSHHICWKSVSSFLLGQQQLLALNSDGIIMEKSKQMDEDDRSANNDLKANNDEKINYKTQ